MSSDNCFLWLWSNERVYLLNLESDQAELKLLAAEGGHSVLVRDASIYMDAPLRLHNIRLEKGYIIGEAKFFIPDTESQNGVEK